MSGLVHLLIKQRRELVADNTPYSSIQIGPASAGAFPGRVSATPNFVKGGLNLSLLIIFPLFLEETLHLPVGPPFRTVSCSMRQQNAIHDIQEKIYTRVQDNRKRGSVTL